MIRQHKYFTIVAIKRTYFSEKFKSAFTTLFSLLLLYYYYYFNCII